MLTQHEYVLPPFEESGFLQRPDVKEFYENTIAPQAHTMAETALVREVTYLSDGLRVKGYTLVPRASARGPRPILIFNRGGNRNYGSLSIHDLLWLHKFVQRGYVIAATQYRGVAGGEGADEFGGADVDDVRNILLVARTLPQADSSRIYIMGHSRGGMMTYLTLKGSHEFNAAAVLAGECDLEQGLADWPEFEKNVYEKLIPDYATKKKEALASRSACYWPEKIFAPVYILQGDKDVNVAPIQAVMMAAKLKALQRKAELEMIPDGDHSVFFRSERTDEIVDRIDRWFQGFHAKPL
ncbi:MAG TPA: prolyl oligopeptidase family serine peptidase [Bdellovibrionota bacterium]